MRLQINKGANLMSFKISGITIAIVVGVVVWGWLLWCVNGGSF